MSTERSLVDVVAEATHAGYWSDYDEGQPWPPLHEIYHQAWLRGARTAIAAIREALASLDGERLAGELGLVLSSASGKK